MDGGCGGGLDFAYRRAAAARRPLLKTTGTRVWTLNPSNDKQPRSKHAAYITDNVLRYVQSMAACEIGKLSADSVTTNAHW